MICRIAVLAVVVLTASVVVHAADEGKEIIRPRSEGLFMCPCVNCKGKWLPNCGNRGCGDGTRLRAWLLELEGAGMNDAAITQRVVERHGESVLATPQNRTLVWLLWLGPWVALAGGLGVLVWLARRWVRRAAADDIGPTPVVDAAEQARVEAALVEMTDEAGL